MKPIQHFLALSLISISAAVIAAPMPNTIMVEDKAVVPILKTEVIRRVAGQEPKRSVDATIFEVTNQGKDIVAREIHLEDNQAQFSEKQLTIPVIQKGGVIVPTSKIELDTTIKQDGKILSQTKKIDAEGVEFKQGQEPIHRTLKLDQKNNLGSNTKTSHAVLTENGTTTRDIVVLSEDE
ncbi:hypothetical protein E0H80_13720 [Acinetobacter sp. ANC 4779]|uniref:hypothetical protein n=1 Tax=Acinetobacter sp. ANC 4779 TaxID=2529848 RepID=UPI00103B2469|nr:hypothetical protein [Acinetobacter sp. ANC 4779]TCB49031.1 hypothetical protein E0H80_13720 [Acinetobacter sp. ANC 4779]